MRKITANEQVVVMLSMNFIHHSIQVNLIQKCVTSKFYIQIGYNIEIHAISLPREDNAYSSF